ncbi:Mitochondrial import inner membrane translocase subunit Tim8 A [Anthophora quadrimaculata]
MRFMEDQSSKGAVDEQFQAFIERESKNQQFQGLAHNLTEICWELCVGTPGHLLDSSTRNCLVNCVNRFIDTSNFIAYRLGNIILNNPKEVDLK